MEHDDRKTRLAGALVAIVCSLALAFVGMLFAQVGEAHAAKKKFAADKGANTVDVSGFPKRIRRYYKTFASKCSRCHTLARPINTNMSRAGWKRYVKRMMNKPDSGISPRSAKRIYRFLKYYQRRKNRTHRRKETSSASSAGGKKSFAADKGADTVDVSGFPKRIRRYYKTFASKCSRCHTLARPINTNMSRAGWKRYVKRMMNKPDSGISRRKAIRIYRFLKYYQRHKSATQER